MIKEVFPEFVYAITYFTGGVVFYIIYKLSNALTFRLKPALRLLPDFIAGLTGGGIFLLITEYLAEGTVLPYSVICYTMGFILSAVIYTSIKH